MLFLKPNWVSEIDRRRNMQVERAKAKATGVKLKSQTNAPYLSLYDWAVADCKRGECGAHCMGL